MFFYCQKKAAERLRISHNHYIGSFAALQAERIGESASPDSLGVSLSAARRTSHIQAPLQATFFVVFLDYILPSSFMIILRPLWPFYLLDGQRHIPPPTWKLFKIEKEKNVCRA
jgi:hypothetical protein